MALRQITLRKIIAAGAAAAAAILAAGLATAAPASAQPRTLTNAGSPVIICAKLNFAYCWVTHGAGAQLTIETGSASGFTSQADGSFWQLFNASQKCLREQPGQQIVVINGCTASDQRAQWTISGPADDTVFTNRATGDVIGVTGIKAGNNVWGGGTGNDYHWVQNP